MRLPSRVVNTTNILPGFGDDVVSNLKIETKKDKGIEEVSPP